MRQLCLIFCCFFCLEAIRSQNYIQPAERASVHFSEVYFEEGFVNGATSYRLLIYQDSTGSSLVQEIQQAYPAFYSAPLAWNQTYSWQVRALDDNDHQLSISNLHRFSTRQKINLKIVTDTRLELTRSDSLKHNNELLMLDYARGIFNRKGEQVWAMPEIPGVLTEHNQVRDLRLSPDSTLTFLGGNVPVEIDFEGKILWKAPSPFLIGNDSVAYHHDFRKTKNGHYFVLGNKKVNRKILGKYKPEDFKNDRFIEKVGDTLYRKILLGLLLEFDQKGKLVWYWDASSYIADEDLNYKRRQDSFPMFRTHMNAFSVNSAVTKAYIGFRDLNRIIRLDLKTKKVEFSYGEKYPSGEAKCAAEFRGQHDASITNRNTLLVFNNNINKDYLGNPPPSNLLEYNDISDPSLDPLKWKFSLKFDSLADGLSGAAGNIDELPNGNFLVCGGGLPRVFEVTRDKQVVWDAFIKGYSPSDSSWNTFPQYRTHWTPQLYRYHFIGRVKKVKNNAEVLIINTGTTTDSYNVEVLGNNKKRISLKKTLAVMPGKQLRVVLNAPPSVNPVIRVSSSSHKTLQKELPMSN